MSWLFGCANNLILRERYKKKTCNIEDCEELGACDEYFRHEADDNIIINAALSILNQLSEEERVWYNELFQSNLLQEQIAQKHSVTINVVKKKKARLKAKILQLIENDKNNGKLPALFEN